MIDNPRFLTEWTEQINEQDNQFGVFNAMGLFNAKPVSQTTLTFQKNIKNVTLIPQTTRRGGTASRGVDGVSELYNLNLPYFEHKDFVGVQDIQGYAASSEDERVISLGEVKAEKVISMRESADQTKEYMQIEAIKGVTKDAYGNTVADMFEEFGLTARRTQEISSNGFSLDFELGTASTDIYQKITDLKRYITKKASTGGAIGKIQVPCSESFFDALKNHPKVREAYAAWTNSGGSNGGKEIYRDELTTYTNWGVTDSFEFNGVLFWTYPAEFSIDKGDQTFETKSAFNGKEGYTIVKGVKDAYRGAFGPSNTFKGANKAGASIYLNEFADKYDREYEFNLEMSPLYWLARPQFSIRCHTSN